nr:tyrosine-type recombinase/integrase [Haliangium sp. UPWRP_2]
MRRKRRRDGAGRGDRGSSGKPRTRQGLHRAVRRLCTVAGVPIVCPHSLRGLWATAGVRSGALSHAVAAALGHGSFKVTAKHYVQPGTLDGTRKGVPFYRGPRPQGIEGLRFFGGWAPNGFFWIDLPKPDFSLHLLWDRSVVQIALDGTLLGTQGRSAPR